MGIPHLDALVSNGHYKELDGGSNWSGHYVLDWNGIEVFYKTQRAMFSSNNKKSLIMDVLLPLDQFAISLLNHPKYGRGSVIDSSKSGIEKEVRTIKAWKDAGIIVPEIIEHNHNAAAYEYIRDSIDYLKLLQDGAGLKEFRALADTHHEIRALAKSKINTDLLHSDLNPSNFLYIHSKNLAIPIDPHLAIKSEKSFEEVDAILNLSFLYRLFDLQIEQTSLRTYLKEFAERLEPSEAELMREYNQEKTNNPTAIAAMFFWLREPVAALIMDRPKRNLNEILNSIFPTYDTNKVELINEALERRTAA